MQNTSLKRFWRVFTGARMFCCDGFKNLITDAGQRGMSAIVLNERPGGFRFILQARAISAEDVLRLSQTPVPIVPPLSSEDNVTLADSIALTYCPFCGTHLQTLVTRATWKRFESLARDLT